MEWEIGLRRNNHIPINILIEYIPYATFGELDHHFLTSRYLNVALRCAAEVEWGVWDLV